MAISFDAALGTYESALKLRSKRAEVLAGNLANVDTPNYKARDFDFHKVLKSEMSSNIKGESVSESVNNMMQYRVPTQPSIDGNTVDEHMEHSEYMSNSLEFQTAFTLLNGRFKGLIGAIRGD